MSQDSRILVRKDSDQRWMFEVNGGLSQTSLYKFQNSSNTIHHQGQGIIDSTLLENKHDYNTECLQIF